MILKTLRREKLIHKIRTNVALITTSYPSCDLWLLLLLDVKRYCEIQ